MKTSERKQAILVLLSKLHAAQALLALPVLLKPGMLLEADSLRDLPSKENAEQDQEEQQTQRGDDDH